MKQERTVRRERPAPLRDARRWYIATEGERTEKDYFQGLQGQGLLSPTRVSLILLPTERNESAPAQVLERLKAHLSRPEVELRPMDEVWLVVDTDHWFKGRHLKASSRVMKSCQELGYELAVSNPCFELWLILHHTADVSDLPDARSCKERFRTFQPGYDAARLDVSRFTGEQLQTAIERARALDSDPGQRLPGLPGTRVYRLMERLVGEGRESLARP